jgi:fructokinase
MHAYDFIALGEILIDLISCMDVESLRDANTYQRFVGGEPTNLSRNMALMGKKVALVACVGSDNLGQHILEQLQLTDIDTQFIQRSNQAPSTIVLVSKTLEGTPDFIPYRGADAHIQPNQALFDAVVKTRILHTSAFALSREPARTTILQAAKIARENGVLISLDPNYHPDVWPDTSSFLTSIRQTFQLVDVTKPSLDDCERIFAPGLEPTEYCQRFHEWGAKTVILSMGSKGVILSTSSGECYTLHPNKISVADVTGAGDAFWAGFLSAKLDGKSDLDAALQGQALAEIKIETVGPLDEIPSSPELISRARSIQYHKSKVI